MRTPFALLIALVAALAVAGGAGAGPIRYGLADDWPKFHPCGDVWWQAAADIGYQDVRMTVQWDETAPAVIPYQDDLQAALDCAALAGIRPILAVYPLHPTAIGSNTAAQASFATFLALVGQAFPSVGDFVVGNEPNVNRFWQPQYRAGHDAAAADYEHTLAAAYDALKVVRPDARVWGPAISSRGNDAAGAASNPSHSPVWFIKDLGDAYRASGRTRPIFDEFDMHPYPPVQDADPFSKPFPWPQAGAADLDRVKEALWDAFGGTDQPVPAQQGASVGERAAFGGPSLPIDLDEAGEQTVVAGHRTAYSRAPENVRPVAGAIQAARHVQLAHIGECDPDVRSVLWFPLIDDSGLSDGFQSGNLYADLTHKQSYGAMKSAIATDRGGCVSSVAGVATTWRYDTEVIGAQASFAGWLKPFGSEPSARPAAVRSVTAAVTAGEAATYVATLLPADPTARPVGSQAGAARAYTRVPIRFAGPFRPGTYTVEVVVRAATNRARTTILVSRAFSIGPRATTAP